MKNNKIKKYRLAFYCNLYLFIFIFHFSFIIFAYKSKKISPYIPTFSFIFLTFALKK